MFKIILGRVLRDGKWYHKANREEEKKVGTWFNEDLFGLDWETPPVLLWK